MEWVKGHDTLLYALKDLPSNVVLAIAGHGTQRSSLEALTKKLNLKLYEAHCMKFKFLSMPVFKT